jgi:copper chaperone CopZ
MKDQPEPADSGLSETMAARIEIKELGDPAQQKKITDAVEALDGVVETKIEKGALHVSYDPLATTEKKIEQAIRSTGTTIKAAATDTEGAHPDLPTPVNVGQAPAKKGARRRTHLMSSEAAAQVLSRKTKVTSLPSANATSARVPAGSELLLRAKQPSQPQEESGCGSGS